jgi:ATP-dependent DNA helicase RecG
MSSDYIEELIRQGGNTSIEFKQGDVRTENLAKELIAFSNSSGGVVLLGIEDNGEVQGLENQRSYEEWLAT